MNDFAIPELSDRRSAKPFTRTLNTPPGWPWDQVRIATLEARHTSPVSGGDIAIVMRRLQPWRFGESGRFVAIYVRDQDIKEGLKLDLDVGGKKVSVDMPSPRQKAEQSRDRLWNLGLIGLIACCLVGLGMVTLQRRTAEAERLTALETQMTRKVRDAEGVARAKADAEALAALNLKNRTVDNALRDLKTISLQRDPSVRLDAFYWNKGYWAIEVHGDSPPVKDATIPLQRSTKPVRKGVWLWVSAVEDGAR
jgi:hypothetical protein